MRITVRLVNLSAKMQFEELHCWGRKANLQFAKMHCWGCKANLQFAKTQFEKLLGM